MYIVEEMNPVTGEWEVAGNLYAANSEEAHENAKANGFKDFRVTSEDSPKFDELHSAFLRLVEAIDEENA